LSSAKRSQRARTSAASSPRATAVRRRPERLGRLELRHVGRAQLDLRQPADLLAGDREHLLGVVDAEDEAVLADEPGGLHDAGPGAAGDVQQPLARLQAEPRHGAPREVLPELAGGVLVVARGRVVGLLRVETFQGYMPMAC